MDNPPNPAHIIKPANVVTVRLRIQINATSYDLTALTSETNEVRRAWRLRKDDGTAYDCRQYRDSTCTCDCPDFLYRRDGKDPDGCKHIIALRAVALLD